MATHIFFRELAERKGAQQRSLPARTVTDDDELAADLSTCGGYIRRQSRMLWLHVADYMGAYVTVAFISGVGHPRPEVDHSGDI
jgi:hypothetical protein